MRKIIFIFSILVILVGCTTNQEEPEPTSQVTIEPTPAMSITPTPQEDIWEEASNNVKIKTEETKSIISVFDDQIVIECKGLLPEQLKLEVVDLEEIIMIRLMYYFDGSTEDGKFGEFEILTLSKSESSDEVIGNIEGWNIGYRRVPASIAKYELSSEALKTYEEIIQQYPEPLFALATE